MGLFLGISACLWVWDFVVLVLLVRSEHRISVGFQNHLSKQKKESKIKTSWKKREIENWERTSSVANNGKAEITEKLCVCVYTHTQREREREGLSRLSTQLSMEIQKISRLKLYLSSQKWTINKTFSSK